MSAEGKYTECCLNLNMNSSIEERRLTFEEMAPNWDKVYSTLNNVISRLPSSFRHSPLSERLEEAGCPASKISPNAFPQRANLTFTKTSGTVTGYMAKTLASS